MSAREPRAAIYARISEDPRGLQAGVQRQLEDCRVLAQARGWAVVEECTDNDISALRGRQRPGYERVLQLVREGRISYVIVWQTSRLLRNRRERADAIELFAKARVGVIAVKGPDLDLSTAYGRGMAGLLGEFDTMESEVKSERVAAAAGHRAAAGRPNGGLGFGWRKNSDGTFTEEPEEAAIIREVVKRLLAGESLLAVTNDLNGRGVPAPMASRWGKTSVKKVALRPSNAGLRVHHRGRDTERVYSADWPALVARREWEVLTKLLADPSRRSNRAARPGARKHLLTWGIGECGVCGARLRVGMKGNQTHGVKKALYLCSEKGCVGRDQARVDELVTGVALERLARPDALSWMLSDESEAREAEQRVAELRTRLEDAADSYAAGKITAEQLERITAQLRPLIDAADAERRRSVRTIDAIELSKLAGPEAATRWESLSPAQRRAVLDVLGIKVRILPARKGPGFDPASVDIEWGRP